MAMTKTQGSEIERLTLSSSPFIPAKEHKKFTQDDFRLV